MPEIAEVETLVRELRPRAVGKRIERIASRQPKMLNLPEAELSRRAGQEVTDVRRRAKSAVLCLRDGGSIWLHMGLTGQVGYAEPEEPSLDGAASITFSDGSRLVVERTFMGHIHFVPAEAFARTWRGYGADPVDEAFTADQLAALVRGKPQLAVKSLLMDQSLIAGIGNAYSDDILYVAGLHPFRKAGALSAEETRRLYDAVRQVLGEAIAQGAESGWKHLDGSRGRYEMKVHGRAECPDGGGKVEKLKVGGRTGYVCPSRQT